MLYLFIIICRTFIHRKVLRISVYGLSSFIVRNVRVHTQYFEIGKINARAFVVCPIHYVLHTVHVLLSLFFWVLFFGTFCKEHTTVHNARKVS